MNNYTIRKVGNGFILGIRKLSERDDDYFNEQYEEFVYVNADDLLSGLRAFMQTAIA